VKFKIKTNLVTGIIMGLFSAISLYIMPTQVKNPAYDSGVPSPRIIPGLCLWIILFFSVVLLAQSLIFKKEKIVEFDWEKEKPAILLIALMCVYVALIIWVGYMIASAVVFVIVLIYSGEKFIIPKENRKFGLPVAPIYIFTVLAGVGIYFLFTEVFHVSLPAGKLWDLF